VVLDGWVRWERAAWWIHQLLCGVSAIHGAGVIHRDIKLDNCLLVREGGREVLKVLDLGLAKVTRAGLLSRPPRSSAGRLVGSLPYMSPEQALCEELDQRTDIYAVGVALFELLTRRQPFVGSDYEVLSGHVEAPPPRPSEVAPLAEIPSALDGLVLRALAKRREERFASAGDFDAALLGALEELDVDVERGVASAGCDEAKACLEAWASFDIERASGQADIAARLDPGWSPLKIMMALSSEE
jgi:serine/threonine-protein kinase